MSEHTWRELERADMDTAAAHRFDEEHNRTTELLPCPFCGGEADEYEGDYGNGIYCMMCGAMVGEPIHLEYRTTKRVSIAEAIAAWNTRAERTCRIEGRYGNQYCTCCGEMVGTWDSTSELYIDGNMVELWNYCPNCGAKVVGE